MRAQKDFNVSVTAKRSANRFIKSTLNNLFNLIEQDYDNEINVCLVNEKQYRFNKNAITCISSNVHKGETTSSLLITEVEI